MFTASTEHDSKTINTITYTCFNRIFEFNSIHQYPWILETFKNLDGLVMEESVYSGADNKF